MPNGNLAAFAGGEARLEFSLDAAQVLAGLGGTGRLFVVTFSGKLSGYGYQGLLVLPPNLVRAVLLLDGFHLVEHDKLRRRRSAGRPALVARGRRRESDGKGR